MKNWQTTVIGAILAALLVIEKASNLDDWKSWILPALVAVFGYLSKGLDISGTGGGKSAGIIIVSLCALSLLPSCSTAPGGKSIPVNVGASYVGDGFVITTDYTSANGVGINVAVDQKAADAGKVRAAIIPMVRPEVIAASGK